jgi:hypothetical protein
VVKETRMTSKEEQKMIEDAAIQYPGFVELHLNGINKDLWFTGRYISHYGDDMIFQQQGGSYITKLGGVIEEYETETELIDTLLCLIHKED